MAAARDTKICEVFKIKELTKKQSQAIDGVMDGNDVFVGTRTGSGKSLTYECIPICSERRPIVVVFAPLVSIMQEQCKKLNDLGFKATCVGAEDRDELLKGDFDFVFGSPESLVGDKTWRNMLQNEVYRERLQCIVVDEAHTVLQWGEKHEDEEEPFRQWFSKIGEVRSLCPSATMIALTATAGPTQRRRIMKELGFRKQHSTVVLDSPDRTNIKITSKCVPNSSDAMTSLKWLIDSLADKKKELPRHVIFCRSIADCARVYKAFAKVMGRRSTYFNMYHSKTTETIKEDIRASMATDTELRVLICTNAAGMGVNFFNVNNVIHFGLPLDIDTFVQQMGRAGRDGSQAHELVIYKAHKGQLKKIDSELLKLVRDTTCRHKTLCAAYCSKLSDITPAHKCCDICAKDCQCESEECPLKHVADDLSDPRYSDDESEVEAFKRDISTQEKLLLKHKLHSYKFHLLETNSNSLIDPEILYGINDDVINEALDSADKLFTPEDVIKYVHIWSYSCAVDIAKIVNNVFGDEEMYDQLLVSDVSSVESSD